MYQRQLPEGANYPGMNQPGFGGSPYGPYKTVREQVGLALDLLYRRKWIILAVFILVVGGTALYIYPAVPVYEAHSYIMVDLSAASPQRGRSQGVDIVPPTDNLFANGNRSMSEELLLLHISSPLAIRVAERIKEMKVRPEDGQPISLLQGRGGERSLEELAAILPKFISFAPERGSINILRITSSTTVRQEAPLLANLFAEEYERMTSEAGRERIAGLSTFLEEQEAERRRNLQQIEAQISTYLAEGGSMLGQADRQMVNEIARLEAQRDEYYFDLQVRQRELSELEEEIRRQMEQLPDQMASSGDAGQMQAKLTELKAHRDQIEQRYPNAAERPAIVESELRRTQALIDELERALRNTYAEAADRVASSSGAESNLSYIGGLRREAEEQRKEIERISGRIKLTEEKLEVARARYARIPSASARLAELERSRTYAEQAYGYVAQRLLEMRIAGISEERRGYVRVLQKARWPIPAADDSSRNLMLGGFIGLLFAMGLAIVIDKLDNRIYKPEQLSENGHIALGIVPDMKPIAKKMYKGKSFQDFQGLQISTDLVALHDPTSPLAETYRPIRLNLEFSLPPQAIKTIVLTSARVGEGKSISAANLAAMMARGGRKTLLIDADLRRPHVAEIFGLHRETGLIQLLRGETSFSLEAARTAVDQLYVLTSGGTTSDAAELLGSERMLNLLNEVADIFDIVILDTPPVMPVTDAALLASVADATILVARAGKTREKELQAATDVLRRVGAKLIGTVLNGFDISKAFGYKYQYQTYSSYGTYVDYMPDK